MNTLPTFRVAAVILAVTAIIAAIALVRSGGDDETGGTDAPVPEGYVTYEGDFQGRTFSFAYPEEWGEVVMKEGSDSDEAFFEIAGPRSEGGTRSSIKLGVQLDSASPEAIIQANFAAVQASGESPETTGPEDVNVVGAVDAKRAEATYEVAGKKDAPEEFGSTLLVAGGADETIFSLILTDSATDPAFDRDAVAGSLEVDVTGATDEAATDV